MVATEVHPLPPPPPPPSASASATDLTFEDLVDADSANFELPIPIDVRSKLQHALAALCVHHIASNTIEPRMLRVILDKAVPETHTIHAKDTLLATFMHKKFAQPPKNTIPVLTTREAVGKTTLRKHETSYGVRYKNLCITGPDVKYDNDRMFADDSDERLRSHFLFLKSILSTHPDTLIRDRKWTKADIQSWFKEADVKKCSKKLLPQTCTSPPFLTSMSLLRFCASL